jgi:hypothetical protein
LVSSLPKKPVAPPTQYFFLTSDMIERAAQLDSWKAF